MTAESPVTLLPGVGGRRAAALRAMGITTAGDLLRAYPRDYDDRSEVKTVAMLTPGAVNTIRGFIRAEPENVAFAGKKGKPLVMTKARLRDATGEIVLVWFNQPYLKQYFKKDVEYIFTGKVKQDAYKLQMESPEYSVWEETSLSGGRVVPVYTVPASVSQKVFRAWVRAALDQCAIDWPEPLPRAVRAAYGLMDMKAAICQIHFPAPDSNASFLQARRRLVFEELFFMQSALFTLKGAVSGEAGAVFPDTDAAPFLRGLPYALTAGQEATLADITGDVQGGRRMNRLVQGDVGSGKTAVAMAAAYLAVKNGFQAAVMAPTEVLAGQHYAQFAAYLPDCPAVLLTGGLPAAARRAALADIASGAARLIIGTHALIQPAVAYRDLALVITDEQHRFGVNQRLVLREKGQTPHTLVMTATPIPRTLGLILYGDMDVSVIRELPPGRQTIKTYCVTSAYRARLHDFIRREAEAGRQAYIVCPAIDESETGAFVLGYTRELAAALPGIRVACLHGRMKPAEKAALMADFKANRVQALVCTTVIEVGVHVAGATLMIVENADRFGLSQLHQLRGRVGRGDAQSYCILVTDVKNPETRQRMKAMTDTSDGFTLAETDLSLRGAGDFFGTRQHGLPGFKIANLYRDMDALKEAQEAAAQARRGAIPMDAEEEAAYSARIAQVLAQAASAGVM